MTDRFLEKLNLDEKELRRRLEFFEITEEDLRRLAELRGFAEKHMDAIIEDLYVLILGFPETRAFFADEATLRRVQQAQRAYFLGLFTPTIDLAYVKDRLRAGLAHERIGMPPKWYSGAYSRYLRTIHAKLVEEFGDGPETRKRFWSIQKRVWLDESLAVDTYVAARAETIERHQAAIRELSTPVIRVHAGVLLLPLIGTIDTRRAEQVMEAVLVQVVEEQAKVMIIDIAGVPVVDTKVADHLLKTTAAVQLLGAETIVTGISPTVAKTVVQLGMDITTMQTRARLADGLELALDLVGKAITPKAPKAAT